MKWAGYQVHCRSSNKIYSPFNFSDPPTSILSLPHKVEIQGRTKMPKPPLSPFLSLLSTSKHSQPALNIMSKKKTVRIHFSTNVKRKYEISSIWQTALDGGGKRQLCTVENWVSEQRTSSHNNKSFFLFSEQRTSSHNTMIKGVSLS